LRLHDGRYECVICGEVLDVPVDREPSIVVKASSGSPNYRTIVFEGVEIHSCEISGPIRPRRS
jgi:hypothetical protein